MSYDEMAQNDTDDSSDAPRSVWGAMKRGFSRKCPSCGKGAMFLGYSKVAKDCQNCGQRLDIHQADDAPPYMTMFIVGHLIIVPVVEMKRLLDPPLGFQLLLWIPLSLMLTLWLLPRVKGALISLQWANRMHGFGEEQDFDPEAPLKQ